MFEHRLNYIGDFGTYPNVGAEFLATSGEACTYTFYDNADLDAEVFIIYRVHDLGA